MVKKLLSFVLIKMSLQEIDILARPPSFYEMFDVFR